MYDRRVRSEVMSCDGKQGGGILANRKRDLAGEPCLVYIGTSVFWISDNTCRSYSY